MATGRDATSNTNLFTKSAASVQAADVFALDIQKSMKKNFVSYPANTYEASIKQQITTCPAWIIQDFSMYLTIYEQPEYISAFWSDNEKYRYKDGVILERVGEWFPEIVTAKAQPGADLVTKKGYYPAPYGEKHGEETFWLRVYIDYQNFDYAERYYEFEHYWRFLLSISQQIAQADARFIRQYIHAWIYGVTSRAVWFEKSSDDQIMFAPTGKDISPDDDFSKPAREYYKNDGEVKKQLKKVVGWALEKHKNRVLYDPVYLSKAMGFPTPGIQDEEFKQELKLPDLSDATKVKQYIKDTYYSKWEENNAIPCKMDRGSSIMALAEHIRDTVFRFTGAVPLQTNTFAYDYQESAKDENKRKLADIQKTRCNGSNLIVLVNDADLASMENLYVSNVTPQHHLNNGINPATILSAIRGTGASVYGCPILLPGWAIVCDRQAFHLYRYFHSVYEEFHRFHLVRSHIGHSMFRPVMFGQVCGATILPCTKNSFTANVSWYTRIQQHKLLSN